MDAILIAANLAAGRKQAALSQNQVAEALAVSRQAVSKWESGKAAPSLACCAALAALYRITPDELLTGKMPPDKTDFPFLPEDSLAEKLRKTRSEAGLSQGALAEALAVSRQSVSKWERGEAEPDVERLAALAALLSLPLSSLLPAVRPETEPAANTFEAPVPALSAEKAGSSAETAVNTPTPEAAPEEDGKKEIPQKESVREDSASPAPEKTPEPADTENSQKSEPEETGHPVTSEEEHPTSRPAEKEPASLKEQVRKNLTLYKELLQTHRGTASHTAHTRPKEKPRKEKSKKIAFRTIADIGPNDPAYVYVSQTDGKLRTILPLLAAVPICTAVIALLIRREYKK